MDAIPSKALFKTIAIGYTFGAGALFLPLSLLTIVTTMATQADIGLAKALGFLILIPFILALQGCIFGAMVMLGLWLLRKVRPSRQPSS